MMSPSHDAGSEDEGDADTIVDSVTEARTNLSEAGVEVEIEEAAADKGCHATDTIELAETVGVRTYIPERKIKGKRNWQDVSEEKRRAVLNNRRRVRGARSKRLQRQRSELEPSRVDLALCATAA